MNLLDPVGLNCQTVKLKVQSSNIKIKGTCEEK